MDKPESTHSDADTTKNPEPFLAYTDCYGRRMYGLQYGITKSSAWSVEYARRMRDRFQKIVDLDAKLEAEARMLKGEDIKPGAWFQNANGARAMVVCNGLADQYALISDDGYLQFGFMGKAQLLIRLSESGHGYTRAQK